MIWGYPYFWKDPYTLVLQIPLFIRRCLRTCLTHSGRAVSIGDITSSYHPYFLQNMQDFLNIHRFHLPHTLQFEEVKPTATHPAGSVDFSLRISRPRRATRFQSPRTTICIWDQLRCVPCAVFWGREEIRKFRWNPLRLFL